VVGANGGKRNKKTIFSRDAFPVNKEGGLLTPGQDFEAYGNSIYNNYYTE
jgi:hypothetical protein